MSRMQTKSIRSLAKPQYLKAPLPSGFRLTQESKSIYEAWPPWRCPLRLYMLPRVCLLVIYLLVLYRTALKMPVLFICIIMSI